MGKSDSPGDPAFTDDNLNQIAAKIQAIFGGTCTLNVEHAGSLAYQVTWSQCALGQTDLIVVSGTVDFTFTPLPLDRGTQLVLSFGAFRVSDRELTGSIVGTLELDVIKKPPATPSRTRVYKSSRPSAAIGSTSRSIPLDLDANTDVVLWSGTGATTFEGCATSLTLTAIRTAIAQGAPSAGSRSQRRCLRSLVIPPRA
jgi:hypothetical protein